jgi:hypothetical protein
MSTIPGFFSGSIRLDKNTLSSASNMRTADDRGNQACIPYAPYFSAKNARARSIADDHDGCAGFVNEFEINNSKTNW